MRSGGETISIRLSLGSARGAYGLASTLAPSENLQPSPVCQCDYQACYPRDAELAVRHFLTLHEQETREESGQCAA